MKQIKDYYQKIKTNGVSVPSGRPNMPGVTMIGTHVMEFPFNEGLPILTGKQMPFYSILGELIGFMKGETDVRAYDKLGCKVWWDNAYKWNILENDNAPAISKELYRAKESQDKDLNNRIYDLGRIYAAQWRGAWSNDGLGDIYPFDQLISMIEGIINNPYSRYHVMDSWNHGEMNKAWVSQPNCHVYFQATCEPLSMSKSEIKYELLNFLDDETVSMLFKIGYNPTNGIRTHLTQRSCDAFLGVPFNITSYSLFTILLAIMTNTLPMGFTWVGVNNHIYDNHQEQVNKYLSNELHYLPRLNIKELLLLKDIEKLTTLTELKDIFRLVDYESEDKIKADLSVGM